MESPSTDPSNGKDQGPADSEEGQTEFDFEEHQREAELAFQSVRRSYEDCAAAVRSVLRVALAEAGIEAHTVESRGKDVDSFGRKAARPSKSDPKIPKYPSPIDEITDLAGARVIAFFLRDVERINTVVESQFTVLEKVDKSGLLVESARLGYHSIHYVVQFSASRHSLPEYAQFIDMKAEIQVRTILQHAWAEIEHDIQYKAIETIPSTIRRRFMGLAGLLEIADREFQAISDEDRRVREDALRRVNSDDLESVEITQESLKAYLDRKFGPDGRMTSYSYEWQARVTKKLGFTTLEELDDALEGYDYDQISRTIWGGRQGQLSRFEDTLLASMGEAFIARHPWSIPEGWFERMQKPRLARLRDSGLAAPTPDDEVA